ncbi:MAG TPA: NAD(P)H-binding protein [Beijerinckiaceae bacterium]|jgi:nucleoside-diphosphate-sugar epimerase|nr:NAD(P)H-binding protein [Beijerinckiaceae bacterium]
MQNKIALVLGATGGIGGEVARRLNKRGWRVRALHRKPEQFDGRGDFVWLRGDAMAAGDVLAAAEGVSLIVHAVNPPGYRNWGELVLPMFDNTLAAARHVGARVLLPGNVYNYGPDAFPLINENSPQHPVTRKGKIRVEMEERLRAAVTAGQVKGLIVGAGDFFGPQAANNWFSQGLVKPGRPVNAISYPGRPGVGHQWAYLPDVAETMVRLAEHDGLDDFAQFHMGGHWDHDGRQMVDAIARVVGAPNMRVSRFPWLAVTLASPFVPLFRELSEMKYLWQVPVRLQNARLLSMLGAEPHTPLDVAVRTTLVGLGCIGVGEVDASSTHRQNVLA